MTGDDRPAAADASRPEPFDTTEVGKLLLQIGDLRLAADILNAIHRYIDHELTRLAARERADASRPQILGYRAPVTSAPYCLACIAKHKPWDSALRQPPVYDTHETCIQCGQSLRADASRPHPDGLEAILVSDLATSAGKRFCARELQGMESCRQQDRLPNWCAACLCRELLDELAVLADASRVAPQRATGHDIIDWAVTGEVPADVEWIRADALRRPEEPQ